MPAVPAPPELLLPDALRAAAADRPAHPAWTFVRDDETEVELSFGELDRRARTLAATLRSEGLHRGDRVLLLHPTGPDFLVSAFACMYAGAIAVPAPPPEPARLARTLPRVLSIVRDARPAFALGEPIPADAGAEGAPLPRWLDATATPAELDAPFAPVEAHPDDVVFLQYTSGSTGDPKGVRLAHRHLREMGRAIEEEWDFDAASVDVVWVPNYHDDGLVHGLLQPVWSGHRAYVLSPAAVVRRPLLWLRTIARVRATHSGGPNFLYELAVSRTRPEDRAGLDLRAWTSAYNAAEPISHGTLRRFVAAFEGAGIGWRTLRPVYGMAETTLVVSIHTLGRAPVVKFVSAGALERGHVAEVPADDPDARAVVGCGRVVRRATACIVDPATGVAAPSGTVGEIWVAGPQVADGYWENAEATEATFRARRSDTGEGPFLRTGDLGFLDDGELFVTGRAKDVIVLRGRNLYPQDLERSVDARHPALRPGCATAFSVRVDDEERLVVAQEVRDADIPDPAGLVAGIRQRLAEEHDVSPWAVVLLAPGGTLKTSSGKLARAATRDAFLGGDLDAVLTWREGNVPGPPASAAGRTERDVEAWLRERVGALLGVAPAHVEADAPLAALGVDSVRALALAEDLGRWLGQRLPDTVLWEAPTIRKLAVRVARGAGEAALARPPASREPIAIVGIGCRFPGGASTPDAYWRLLLDGVDATHDVPADRWDADALYDPDPNVPGRLVTRRGGFCDGIDAFDPAFFGISPREAGRMDPQQRLLLEVAWEALEDAGIAPPALAGSATGVFVGIGSNEYARHTLYGAREAIDAWSATGVFPSVAAGRWPTSSGCAAPRCPSTPPAPLRSSRCTSPARACAGGSAPPRSRAA